MDNCTPVQASWHVLWTHSNYERSVYEQLSAKGYELFFAKIDQWIASNKGKHLVRVPMFRSYLFIRHAIGKHDYIDINKTKGLVRILGDRWDQLASIPDHEIDSIRAVCASDCPVRAYPFLKHGDRVRMVRGSLKNTEGILLRNDDHTGLLVISVALLNRSVSVEVNCTDVVPL
ncbi:MAG: transcription termination/antitermination NusG family protein [Pseudohongiella sp.]|uniref:transcription termination/antitermination protein NusG n=1 Tax=Pseudohongiella sp. TaxID=1979412 RepID=UPI00349FD2DD